LLEQNSTDVIQFGASIANINGEGHKFSRFD
jgi:hypothetical protein